MDDTSQAAKIYGPDLQPLIEFSSIGGGTFDDGCHLDAHPKPASTNVSTQQTCVRAAAATVLLCLIWHLHPWDTTSHKMHVLELPADKPRPLQHKTLLRHPRREEVSEAVVSSPC